MTRRDFPAIGGGFAVRAAVLCVAVVGMLSAPAAATPDAGDSPEAQSGAPSGSSADVAIEQSLEAEDPTRAGTPIDLRLTVVHPAGAEVRAEPDLESSRWKLLERRTSAAEQKERPATELTLTFQVFRPGEATLEPFDVVVTTRDGEETVRKTDPASVRVESVLGDEDPQLRPAQPPHTVWTGDYTLAWAVWIGGGVGGTLALGLVAFFLFRSRREVPSPTPTRPPEQEALERLEALKNSDLVARGDFMVLYVRLSQTIRRYLGRRFGFPGPEMTTAEIVERLDDDAWEGEVDLEQIADWMRRVDLVKFSGRIPSTEEAHSALEEAIEIVRDTQPSSTDE